MRLVHPLLSAPIHWAENQIPVLIMEDPRIFREMVFDLSMQAVGEDGPFVLSLNYEPLECTEHLQVIRDYVSLPLDDRKLQSRFQAVLHETVRETLQQETDQLDRMIGDYLRSVAATMDYPVSFSGGEYALPLLKAVKCQPVLDGDSPLEQLMQYFELYAGLTKNPVFVLVSAKSYFDDEELGQIYRMANYQKWKMLLLENRSTERLPWETSYIIDWHLCEIRLDFGEKDL